MLNIAILILFLIGFIVGLKRGFILQLVHLTSVIISFLVAYAYYEELAPKLTLWVPYPQFSGNSTMKLFFEQTNLDDVYYRAIAFAIIFFAVKILLHMIGSMLDFIAYLPILKQLNTWGGGILGFVEVYLISFFILYIAALLPIESIQLLLDDSMLAKEMIKHTPVFSEQIKDMWFK